MLLYYLHSDLSIFLFGKSSIIVASILSLKKISVKKFNKNPASVPYTHLPRRAP